MDDNICPPTPGFELGSKFHGPWEGNVSEEAWYLGVKIVIFWYKKSEVSKNFFGFLRRYNIKTHQILKNIVFIFEN